MLSILHHHEKQRVTARKKRFLYRGKLNNGSTTMVNSMFSPFLLFVLAGANTYNVHYTLSYRHKVY